MKQYEQSNLILSQLIRHEPDRDVMRETKLLQALNNFMLGKTEDCQRSLSKDILLESQPNVNLIFQACYLFLSVNRDEQNPQLKTFLSRNLSFTQAKFLLRYLSCRNRNSVAKTEWSSKTQNPFQSHLKSILHKMYGIQSSNGNTVSYLVRVFGFGPDDAGFLLNIAKAEFCFEKAKKQRDPINFLTADQDSSEKRNILALRKRLREQTESFLIPSLECSKTKLDSVWVAFSDEERNLLEILQ